MKTEDQLYGLMAQAEDIQEHAVKLQKTALKAISALEGATQTVGEEMRSRGLFWAVCGAAILLVVGMLVLVGLKWAAEWTLADLHREAAEYRAEIAALKETSAKLQSETWGLKLTIFTDGKKGIVLPKGMKYERHGKVEGGQYANMEAIVLK